MCWCSLLKARLVGFLYYLLKAAIALWLQAPDASSAQVNGEIAQPVIAQTRRGENIFLSLTLWKRND